MRTRRWRLMISFLLLLLMKQYSIPCKLPPLLLCSSRHALKLYLVYQNGIKCYFIQIFLTILSCYSVSTLLWHYLPPNMDLLHFLFVYLGKILLLVLVFPIPNSMTCFIFLLVKEPICWLYCGKPEAVVNPKLFHHNSSFTLPVSTRYDKYIIVNNLQLEYNIKRMNSAFCCLFYYKHLFDDTSILGFLYPISNLSK